MENTDRRECVLVCGCLWFLVYKGDCARACASKFVSSSKRNDNESTDTSKGPGRERKKRGSTEKKREKMQN